MKTRRLILEEDYPVIKTWWERRGGEPPPLNMLPDVGVIVEEDGTSLACAFLYKISNAQIAIVEWEATNPDFPSPTKRLQALNMAFDFFEEWTREKEHVCLITWVKMGRGDGRLLSQRGWIHPQGEPHEMLAYIPTKEAVCH